ncbi:MAG TPA: S53 family peptidase [Acidimicrobiales bacterium]|nr:S53 family peptidase [Acidimicrobiales bacterium]
MSGRRRFGIAAAGLCAAIGLLAGIVHAAPGTPAVVRLTPGAIVSSLGPASSPPTTAGCLAQSGGKQACYDPAQLRVAYDLAPLYAKGIEGQHETIVIVDAYGSPTITADLATFDSAFSLPAPPSFKIIRPRGPIPPYSPTGKDRFGWASETSLDVEWAHALAPMASILLVETPTDEVEGTTGFPDIVAAENYVIAHKLGQVISQSFGATEQTFSSRAQLIALRSAFLAAKKASVTVLGGSGDLGATDYEYNAVTIYPRRVTSWPASDPLVTAVGGTKLDLDAAGNQLSPAVAWNDTYERPLPSPNATGGGHSEFFKRPSFQNSVKAAAGDARSVPDISMSAACTGLVDTYVGALGAGGGGWRPMCGTSEATPLFAAIVALADQEAGRSLGLLNPALYGLQHVASSGLVPVTSGNNTVAFHSGGKTVTVTGFASTAAYNLATGLGTIDAALFVPALVHEWNLLHKT